MKNKVNWFWNKIRYGLVLYGIRNRLAKLGLDINLLYLEQEGTFEVAEPVISKERDKYSIKSFDADEMKAVGKKYGISNIRGLIEGFDKGQKCIGLMHENGVAAFMFTAYDQIKVGKMVLELRDKEAYLLNMFTIEGHRGRNLAPYLRYHSYDIIRKEGITKIYSITNFFNKSSLRFKKKLKATHEKLYCSITIFKKYHFSFLLKKY
ncbi:hypothetical protein [Flagellimonas marinaquae]|uniref:hypothetical protein n=1 Tax=Flagellimonas marinaquae TaxID=254955 RepID=UPI002074B047|nr:hypothetical protein [Allomuricauda aquimarina]USD24815.1 hypothetical protein MJO53_14140 [Allomuricauda aquimarina]